MSETIENPDEIEEEYEVVELESEDGDKEEFVIVDRISVEKKEYAVMALLEDFENLESMTESEFEEFYGDEDIFMIMRQEDEAFLELTEEEFKAVRDELDNLISAQDD